MKTVIAIDGPAGSGKSTLAAALAAALGLRHVDTGAMYRAVTLEALRKKVDLGDDKSLAEVAAQVKIRIEGKRAWLGTEEVSDEIRSAAVTGAVSTVAAVPAVRTILVDLQRSMGSDGVVMEGRDIGSIVFPDADLKIYLTAEVEQRAHRRAKELGDEVHGTQTELERRDSQDSDRPISPLSIPEGAVVIDNTDRGVDEVVKQILRRLKANHAGDEK